MIVDIELQITARGVPVVALVIGRNTQSPLGTAISVAQDAQLTYMGRAQPSRKSETCEYVYSFVLRIPAERAVDVGTDLLWNIVTSTESLAEITRFGILTREATVDVDPRGPEGRHAIEAAIRTLLRSPIPQSLWLGE